jgi:hypothetical protein
MGVYPCTCNVSTSYRTMALDLASSTTVFAAAAASHFTLKPASVNLLQID